MIKTKEQLGEYLALEEKLYREIGYKGRLHARMTKCEVGEIFGYVRSLRKDEYYTNRKNGVLGKLSAAYYRRKHNKLGVRLGISVPVNTFGKGLVIYHSQGIIVHRDARCGENCKLHGLNCIGNNGRGGGENNCPTIGNGLDLGVGAMVIGNVRLADNTTVAANAVVCKSFENENQVLAGVPAKAIK